MSGSDLLFTKEHIMGVTAKYKGMGLNKFEFLTRLISKENKISEDENETAILLGCILYDYTKKEAPPFIMQAQENAFFNKVKTFCECVLFCKKNVHGICDELRSLGKIKLKDIDYKNNFNKEYVFNVHNLRHEVMLNYEPDITEIKQKERSISYSKSKIVKPIDPIAPIEIKSIPKLKLKNMCMESEITDSKTQGIAYNYLYSVFVKSYPENDYLPIIIFQSIFYNARKLLELVDDSFFVIKNKSASESDNVIINFIKKNDIKIFNDPILDDRWIRRGSFILSDFFFYKNFNEHFRLDAIEWYEYFIGLCNLLCQNKQIDVRQFYKNCIVFLFLSDIFDLVFDNDSYENECNFRADKYFECEVFDDFGDTVELYRFPVFNWDIFLLYEKTMVGELLYFAQQTCSENRNISNRTLYKEKDVKKFIEKNYNIKDIEQFFNNRNSYIREVKANTKDISEITSTHESLIINEFDRYFSKLMKKEIYKYLLDFVGITQAREKLKKQ